MLIGVLQIDLFIPESNSLKEKRMILKSLKQRLANKYNISIAETLQNDKWQRSVIGIAMVSNDKKFIERTMNQIRNFIDNEHSVEILEHQFELL